MINHCCRLIVITISYCQASLLEPILTRWFLTVLKQWTSGCSPSLSITQFILTGGRSICSPFQQRILLDSWWFILQISGVWMNTAGSWSPPLLTNKRILTQPPSLFITILNPYDTYDSLQAVQQSSLPLTKLCSHHWSAAWNSPNESPAISTTGNHSSAMVCSPYSSLWHHHSWKSVPIYSAIIIHY